MSSGARVDHLVVVAAELDEGVTWCQDTLGAAPGPGGKHPRMGTWNRLLRLGSALHPRAYLEIIAIDPQACGPRASGKRWFDMDDERLRAAVVEGGPRLVHLVAEVDDIGAGVTALAGCGIDRGEVHQMSRSTGRGELQWQITVREDGRRLFDGCLPTLIRWRNAHPTATMPDSHIGLAALAVTHPQAAQLRAACAVLGLRGVPVHEGAAAVVATLETARGRVVLSSQD